MTTLAIELPDDVLVSTNQSSDQLRTLAREAVLVRLYDLGALSSGQAARALGVTRWAFLDLLSRYHVSPFDETMDVAAEAQHG